MNNVVIRVEDLGKEYHIGRKQKHRTLSDTLINTLTAVPSRLSNGRRGKTEPIWALQNVSFEVREGEILGIIGRNGAGKSTLLKILSRITRPTTGSVKMRGRIGSLLEVGTGFHPELTGRENIYLNGAILGMKRAEIDRRFDEIVAFAEVDQFLDTPVKRYSSGMYVRLAFAVAAHLEPEILIVDEVLAVGDAAFQKKCLGRMSDVAQGGRTVLFVSHNMSAVQRLCSRSLMLEQGQVVADADTASVVMEYLKSDLTETKPASWVDVAHLNPKRTAKEVFIDSVWYSGCKEEIHFRPYSRGPLEVALKVVSRSDRANGRLAVTLYDRNGTKLVNADTAASGEGVNLRAGSNVVRFRIEELYLNPGEYTLGWWAADTFGHVFDAVDSGLRIEVIDFEAKSWGVRPHSDGAVASRFGIVQEN